MSPAASPASYLWWLVSRAAGVVALVLISLSVLIGLVMANKLLRRPGLRRGAVRTHEHVALMALIAIGAHGLSLLGDHWLKPGLSGITIPFAISYRPAFLGIGIIGGYLALLLGPSFYLRRRIGARRWRKVHTLIALAWIMSVVHTIGAGSDAHKLWLQLVIVTPGVLIVYLLALRVLSSGSGVSRRATRQPASTASHAAAGARPRAERAIAGTAPTGRAHPAAPASGRVGALP